MLSFSLFGKEAMGGVFSISKDDIKGVFFASFLSFGRLLLLPFVSRLTIDGRMKCNYCSRSHLLGASFTPGFC